MISQPGYPTDRSGDTRRRTTSGTEPRTFFWGARYTRSWFTTLVGLPVLAGIYFSVLGGTPAWVALVPLLVVVLVVIWAVPLAAVGTDGVRLILERRTVPWDDVASVLDPRPGDESVRLELTDGKILRATGVPPEAVPALRAARR